MSTAAQSMSILMLVCATPMLGLAAYGYRNLEKPGARGFLLCQVGAIGWSIQLALLAWPGKLLPIHLNTGLRQLFQFCVAFGWLLLVWGYSNRERVTVSRSLVAALLVVPLVTLVLAVTNPAHELVLGPDMPANPVSISQLDTGPWYFVSIAYAVAVVVPPVGILVDEVASAHGAHRNQLLLLLAGWLIGFPGALQTYLFRNFEAIPTYVDLTPLAFSVSATLWGVALFRYHLFGLVPVSRRTTVETMADPVIAVDANQTVVDANPAACRLFDVDSDDVAGVSLASFCQGYPELVSMVRPGESHSEDITLDDAGPRHFSLDVCPIEQSGSTFGSVLVFREVTQLRERERELDLLKQIHSRVLRHNIRNQLTVLKGQTFDIADRDDGTFDEQTQRIRETAETLLEYSEKATDLRDIIDSDAETVPGTLTAATRQELSTLRTEHPSVDVACQIDDAVHVRAHPDIHRAIRELLHNAVMHTAREDTRLRVSVTETDSQGVLTVEDNGPGISETEVATLEAGEETALQHGSGLGLWMVRLLVDKSGGTLSFDCDTELGGTRVEIRLPTADHRTRAEKQHPSLSRGS
ncbi:PAS domain S-box-containing protein [Halovenus aranensis]|uniref:histidine kinase n=1 Tax=Halovenus aranensis TaxID=890420 RepID=A0A1G8UPU3_9EURY|nr:histidine kinase N-terminal 7TM domain-containing protein [Halovenus aranensis]SDJ55749.1 PAS domain S-box-containing protein [Halovenus aranensis]